MDRGGTSSRSRGSFSGGGRGGFRGSGRGRGGGYSNRDRDGPPSRRGYSGRGSFGRGGGGDRFEGGRFKESAGYYGSRDYESSRPPRDYRPAVTPPPDRDRRYGGGPSYERDIDYKFDRYGSASDLRSSGRDYRGPGPRDDYFGPRDYPPARSANYFDVVPPRDYPPGRDFPRSAGRDYAVPSGRRYSLEPRDVGGRNDFPGGGRYDTSPPRGPRRDGAYPAGRGFGPRYGDYPDAHRAGDGARPPPVRRSPVDGYLRGGLPQRDDRSRDARMRRPSPRYELDSPPSKRMRGGPPSSRGSRPRSSRGGPPRRY